jgi:hypothetical protein
MYNLIRGALYGKNWKIFVKKPVKKGQKSQNLVILSKNQKVSLNYTK